MSVVLSESLRKRLLDEAAKRGLKLSPVMRELLSERVQALDEEERLGRAQEWQRARAWSTWEKLKAGDRREVSQTDLDADFDEALRWFGDRG